MPNRHVGSTAPTRCLSARKEGGHHKTRPSAIYLSPIPIPANFKPFSLQYKMRYGSGVINIVIFIHIYRDMTTRDLLIVQMASSGYTISSIALKLGCSAQLVRGVLKKPEVIAFKLEQEGATDDLIKSLYRDGAEALRRALVNPNPQYNLKAAELVFRVLGKMQPKQEDHAKVHIEKLLQVIQAPPTRRELDEAKRYLNAESVGAGNAPKAVQGAAVNSE